MSVRRRPMVRIGELIPDAARQLGAEVISTPGIDIGEALLRIARQHNVTQIVIGKPLGSRTVPSGSILVEILA